MYRMRFSYGLKACVLFALIGLSGLVKAQDTGRELNYGRSELARALAPREAVDLVGEWETRRIPRAPEKGAALADWVTVRVPHVYDLRSNWRDICQYRRKATLPSVRGRRVSLHVGVFNSDAEISINGKVVAKSVYPIPAVYDVTEAIRDGENDFALSFRLGQEDGMAGIVPRHAVWAVWEHVGLSAPIWLEYHDAVSVNDVAIDTKVTPEKVFTAKVEVTNATDAAQKVVVRGWLRPVKNGGASLECAAQTVTIPARGSTQVAVSQPWADAQLWSPDTPNLSYFDVVVEAKGRRLDALRSRFGFREITLVNDEIRLNGTPLFLRHDSCGGWTREDTPEEIIRRYKSRGINSMRTDTRHFAMLGDAADEMGFLFLLNGVSEGKARDCKPGYWANKKEADRLLAKAYMNRPSVVVWYLGCEFGSVYGIEGTPNWKELVAGVQDVGANMAKVDPTRPWLFSGDIECGAPFRGPGPMPLRSFHYPFGPGDDVNCLPEMAYWYAKGRISWQGVSTKNKPLLIDEDFYHGLNDNFLCATKWAGDSIFTEDGWLRAWFNCVRMFADGYYEAGLSGWEIWVSATAKPRNRLFELMGENLTPDYLIALRETFPNWRSGTQETRTLKVFSRTFVDRPSTLRRRIYLDGKLVEETTRDFVLSAGRFWKAEEKISVPQVPRPTAFDIVYELVSEGQTLAKRRYEGSAFPMEEIRFPAGAVLLAETNSPLIAAGAPCVPTVKEAIAAGRPIVVARSLSVKEGLALKRHVVAGGRVMLLDLDNKSWAPAQLVFNRHQSFVWRRAEGALSGLEERMLRVWRPDTELGDSGYVKDGANAYETLLDSGHANGLDGLQVGRLYMGKGHWFLAQLPVMSRLEVEPAAVFTLNAMLDEFMRGVKITKAFRPNDWGKSVIELDEAGLRYLESRGTSLEALGLTIEPLTNALEWVTRTANAGLMRGISNDDLFLSLEKPSDTNWGLFGSRPKAKRQIAHGILVAKPESSAKIYTTPGVVAEVTVAGRRVAVTTLKLRELLSSYPRKTGFLIHTLALNLGVNTARIPSDSLLEPQRLEKVMNRRLWKDPKYAGDKAWFENGNDMRYFPVNLCGWSLDSNNKCPVQDFPRDPVNLAGLPFRLPFDTRTLKSGCIVIEPGETVTIPSWTRDVTGLHFLGAGDVSRSGGKGGVLEVAYGYRQPQEDRAAKATAKHAVFRFGDHFGCYRWPGGVKTGKVAWSGYCQLDRNAALYTWYLKSEASPDDVLSFIDLTNTGDAPVALVGLTFEKRLR